MSLPLNQCPIAVFDSGVGGLTVLASLQQMLPQESFIYLGDTARVPYGTKSPATIIRYTLNAANTLIQQHIKLLVIACNTASTIALKALKQAFPDTFIIGVVEPGAAAACAATHSGHIAVIATEATVQSKGYQQAIEAVNPQATVITRGCSLLVALAEEGWTTGPIAEMIVARYLTDFLEKTDPLIDCLVLGCTHFPILQEAIRRVIPPQITIIDSANATAAVVKAMLKKHHLNTPLTHPTPTHFLITDSPDRFHKVAKNFLHQSIDQTQLEWIDTTHFINSSGDL